ncbi:hypothetical protein CCACVL1_30106 [Corchorus capsularis]|uniref:non-specific serine/threonine protein kinase n=1 Tax=Corchorus capsularis TaxID=210143 RepID=A0A1R3FYP2_COCAP|nr:hypothetical protein CCACVL1_30106 [Corchorus capsularis]
MLTQFMTYALISQLLCLLSAIAIASGYNYLELASIRFRSSFFVSCYSIVDYIEFIHRVSTPLMVNKIPDITAQESENLVKKTAENVDEAVRELPDANMILDSGEKIGLQHFKPVKPLGSGDTGSVHLVELCETGLYFAMKAMDKGVMLNRNKVHRACAEREILDMLDHPFLPALYASFQTKAHICLIMDYCPGGELFLLLDRQPMKVMKEDAVRFYVAEVIVALEYLHIKPVLLSQLWCLFNAIVIASGYNSLELASN